jgi:16S rRNA (uracil1498-N3)-methyltransferase
MSERFYVNLPLTTGPFLLDGPEAHHLATVCRLRPGAEVCLFNGDGREYPARVTQVAKRAIALEVERIDEPQRELPFTLEVAAPLPKGDRAQFMLEKLTELGVTQFVPLHCHYSNTHPRESKRDKLERYVIEASKQCGRNVLMGVGDMVEWAAYCQQDTADEVRIMAHPDQAASLNSVIRAAPTVRIAVGPEGGFTDEEVALASAHGWRPVSLGPRILRVETAALVLASALTVG